MKLNVKDKVALRGSSKHGVIVLELSSGRYKVLWDEDWYTGRTFIYESRHLNFVN